MRMVGVWSIHRLPFDALKNNLISLISRVQKSCQPSSGQDNLNLKPSLSLWVLKKGVARSLGVFS